MRDESPWPDNHPVHPSSVIPFKRFLVKIHQFYSRGCGLKTFVAQFHASAINCLIHVVGGDNSKNHWHACLQPCLADAASHFASDVFEVRCLSSNDRAEANYSVKFFGLSSSQSYEWNFKSAGNFEYFHRFRSRSQAFQRVEGALQKPRANEIVPPTRNDREMKSRGA